MTDIPSERPEYGPPAPGEAAEVAEVLARHSPEARAWLSNLLDEAGARLEMEMAAVNLNQKPGTEIDTEGEQ